jgi:hypothetical protein
MRRAAHILNGSPANYAIGLLASLLMGGSLVSGQTLGCANINYWPEMGVDVPAPEACVFHADWQYSGCFCWPTPFDYLPALGYPMKWAIFSGLNDTLSFWINFYNTSDTICHLGDKDCEHWYVPRLYPLGAIKPAVPLDESDRLGYRIRGWFVGMDMAEPQKEVPHLPSGGIGLIMNIWNLPEGRFQVCLEPTDKVPSGFPAMGGGLTYELYPPRSVADSINGYWGCFWRAIWDKDYDAAERWVDAMLKINPTSVPAHSDKALLALQVHDTATAKQALDDALKLLADRADPALPDSSKRALFQAEKLYLDELDRVLNENRRRLGP